MNLQGRSTFLFLILLALLLVCIPRNSKILKYTQTGLFFGTQVKVDVCYESSQKEEVGKAVVAVWKRWEDIHWRMNVFNDKSDVANVNNSFRSPVKVGADTYYVIQEALHFNQLSSGVFDITVWPLIKLWKESAAKNQLPTPQQLTEVKKALGPQNIYLMPDNRVQVLNKETKIDLGGIAAGYAADEATKILRSHGFEDFLVDTGGDFYAGGLNCSQQPWRIAIKDPFDQTKILNVVQLSNAAVSTSGDYQQFYEIQGQRWTHIMNPITGYPEKGIASATVIAPTDIEADAMATALCILGGKQGSNLIDSLGPQWASIVITREERGAQQYESKNYRLFTAKAN